MNFENFSGRSREVRQVMQLMYNEDVFVNLPQDTLEFIFTNYSDRVPYHNQIHVLYGLLWLHHKNAPLLAKLAWIGHDAGHNGIKEESPEVKSAYITWQWLKNHTEWLAAKGIDPQDGTRIIDATRFPYTDRNNKNHWIQWVRWADTLRIYSGDTAQYLSGGKKVTDTKRFCACFFESAHVFQEMEPPTTDFGLWLPTVQKPFFRKLHALLASYALCLRPEMDGLRDTDIPENLKKMENLFLRLHKTDFLTNCYNFLSDDVTYPEFADFVAIEILK